MTSSPKFKNLSARPKQSPLDLKEKMRKNYKNKIHNCRGMLMDKLRGSIAEEELHTTLTNIYKSMFNLSEENFDNEEMELMDELKNELVQEELDWWIKEYEKCQMINVDWSTLEEINDIICPVCQKTNLKLNNSKLCCSNCMFIISTPKSLVEVKTSVMNLVDSHNSVCTSDVQFALVTENETHIYMICDICAEMKLVI